MVVVGPDGVGKTTIARALINQFEGSTGYFHFRPPVQGGLRKAPPHQSTPPPGKGAPRGSIMLGWVRLAFNVLRFWVGYGVSVRPAVRRGELIVADRWAYGYVAQPAALRFYGPEWLARLALRLLPQPDLVVNLTAPPAVIRARNRNYQRRRSPRSSFVGCASMPGDVAMSMRSPSRGRLRRWFLKS